jgi:phosphoglycerate kinase
MVQPVPQLESLPLPQGTRVLLRADFNVPLYDGSIEDDLRIAASLPTIEWLQSHHTKVVCCSHLGRPKGKPDPAYSLAPVAERLGELLGTTVTLAPHIGDPDTIRQTQTLPAGGVMLVENLRFDPGEEANDPAFVHTLAELGDVYVDDAFGAAHRAHASIVGPPHVMPSAGGRLLAREVDGLGQLLERPARPFVVVLGGVKVSDKLGVIDALLDRCDQLLIGGAMAFTFLVADGGHVGHSFVEPAQVEHCRQLLATGKVVIPTDAVAADAVAADATARHVSAQSIPDGWTGVDIGPETAGTYADIVAGAATVLWNGPMGIFEMAQFAAGTRTVAEAVADCRGFTVVGGGDSAAAVREMGFADRVDHVSTGGGAALELIEFGDLPGLEALRRDRQPPR